MTRLFKHMTCLALIFATTTSAIAQSGQTDAPKKAHDDSSKATQLKRTVGEWEDQYRAVLVKLAEIESQQAKGRSPARVQSLIVESAKLKAEIFEWKRREKQLDVKASREKVDDKLIQMKSSEAVRACELSIASMKKELAAASESDKKSDSRVNELIRELQHRTEEESLRLDFLRKEKELKAAEMAVKEGLDATGSCHGVRNADVAARGMRASHRGSR